MTRDVAQDYREAGRQVAALRHLAAALRHDPENADLYDQSSRALFVALDQADDLSDWDEAERHGLYRQLLHHTPCPAPMLTLAHEAASNLSSGNREGVTALVRELEPVLIDALANGQDDPATFKNVVVFLLTTRAVSGPWLSQPDLSRLHLDWFERFSPDDLALPYSVMFNADLYGQNRSELLQRYVPDRGPAKIDHLPPDTVLFLSWLSGRDPFDDATKRANYLERHLPGSALDRSAAKALLVHAGDRIPAAKLATWDIGDIADVLDDFATRRARRAFMPSSRTGAKWLQRRSYQGVNAALWKFAPALAGRRKPKVAICLSGQLRGFETALATWKTTILAGIDPVFFVHSWTGIGRSDAQPFRYVLPFEGQTFSDTYRRVGLAAGYDAMRNRYPSLFNALAAGNTIDEQSVKTAYGTEHVVLEDDTHSDFDGFTNQQKMHYKIHAADQLAQNAADFDLHMRLRPDLAINLVGLNWNDLVAVCRARPVVFAEKPFGLHYNTLMIGDQCAVATPKAMASYAQTWLDYPTLAAAGLARFPDTFTGHASLALTAWAQGICVERLPIRFGTLQEAAPLGNAEILAALEQDSRGDSDDTLLLDAVRADLKGP